MKRSAALCLVLVLAMVIPGIASEIDGVWETTMDGFDGPMVMLFTFNVSGDTLTGNVEGPMGDLPITNGKVNGKEFTFDVALGEMTIAHRCTLQDKTISMIVPGMDGDIELILRRPEEKK